VVFGVTGRVITTYNNDTGLPAQLRTYLDPSTFAETNFVYDGTTGNLLRFQKPMQNPVNGGSNNASTYTYDSHQLFVYGMRNELGHLVRTTYDVATGVLIKREGPNAIHPVFNEVILACAAPRKGQAGTWIHSDMISAYITLHEMGFTKATIEVPDFNVTPTLIGKYEATRNYPAINGTSHLGPHLRFGTVSVRQMVQKAQEEKNQTFWNELIWREFFMQILWHFPLTVYKAFKPKYDRIPWRNDEKEFEMWKKGETGYQRIPTGAFFSSFSLISPIRQRGPSILRSFPWNPRQ